MTELSERSSQGSKFALNIGQRLGLQTDASLLFGMEDSTMDLTFLFESLNELAVAPSDLGSKISKTAEFASRSQTKVGQSSGDNLTLNLVVRVRHTFKDLEAVHSKSSSLGLVGNHSSDGSPEDAGGGTIVKGSSSRICVHALLKEGEVFELVAEERTRDVDLLASHTNHFLTKQKLLGNQ